MGSKTTKKIASVAITSTVWKSLLTIKASLKEKKLIKEQERESRKCDPIYFCITKDNPVFIFYVNVL
jgi:hypothetical protein